MLALSALVAVGGSFSACEKDDNDDVQQEENKPQSENPEEQQEQEEPQNHENSPLLGIWEIDAYNAEHTGAEDKSLKDDKDKELLAKAAEIIGLKLNADGTAKVDDPNKQFWYMPSSHGFRWKSTEKELVIVLKVNVAESTKAQIDAAKAGHVAAGSILMNLTRKGIILTIKDDMLIETVNLAQRKQALEDEKQRIMEKYGFATEEEAKELADELAAEGKPLDQAIKDAEAEGASEEELNRLEAEKDAWMNALEQSKKKASNRVTQNEAAQVGKNIKDITNLNPIIDKFGATIEFIFRKK
ncbi:MAG: hypothetical protein CSA97_00295 [Bacteroidetes bacterium]|nr:MAG: hypothetical protein CSA97_00295 [Bacteroidota bacterium]